MYACNYAHFIEIIIVHCTWFCIVCKYYDLLVLSLTLVRNVYRYYYYINHYEWHEKSVVMLNIIVNKKRLKIKYLVFK